ncbi:MAG: hypothetical protein IJD94_05950 [Clostridia bacterium]|nr:hypothetical protein [Clostridia bacterium]
MQAQARQHAADEKTTLAFKRHILDKSSGFASEPMADLYRVHLLGMMLNRYDELREKGMSEISSQNRVRYEFDDIAQMMREQGFEEAAPDESDEEERLSRWPLLSEDEALRYMQQRDDYLHKIAMGSALCSACVAPLMVGAAFAAFWYADAFSMLGLVGMFAMIGMGVYAITTAVKPKSDKKIRKGRFSLSARLRRKLERLHEEAEDGARKRTGKGIAAIVMSLIPLFIGSALTELWGSDGWAILGLAGMFLVIGAGVYELVMADGEKKSIKKLLKSKGE